MNSIRRPRKRPRVESVSFRTFGWLLVREGAWGVLRGFTFTRSGGFSRATLLRLRSARLRELVARVLSKYPPRRYSP